MFFTLEMGDIYPLVICYIANWKMAKEIVDLPSLKMVIFHSYVNVYQRVPRPSKYPKKKDIKVRRSRPLEPILSNHNKEIYTGIK